MVRMLLMVRMLRMVRMSRIAHTVYMVHMVCMLHYGTYLLMIIIDYNMIYSKQFLHR